MKKTKLTRSLLAACSIVALSAVMYGCVHNGGDDAPATDMSGTPVPEPMPEPMEPAGPTDLEETQTAAADAAAAAMTASRRNAKGGRAVPRGGDDVLSPPSRPATTRTPTPWGAARPPRRPVKLPRTRRMRRARPRLLPRQGGGGDHRRCGGRCVAHGGGSPRRCRGGRGDGDGHEWPMAAIEAAMTELHIDGTVKSVGDELCRRGRGQCEDTGSGTVGVDRKVITGLIRFGASMSGVTAEPFSAVDFE